MVEIRKLIRQWKEEALAPNQNDVLMTLLPDKNAATITPFYTDNAPIVLKFNSVLKRFYKQHNQHYKETGSPIFGLVKDTLSFTLDGKNYTMPHLIAAASIRKNHFNAKLVVEQTEDFYRNPLLDIKLQEKLPECELEELAAYLQQKGLQKVVVKKGIWAANVHPHRFVLNKELDELIASPHYSNSLKNLLGFSASSEQIEMSEVLLFPADVSQRKAIEGVAAQDVVIQGPPGTGKSQVIANLIGKMMNQNKTTLLVAEKSVALQVIYDKLKRKNVHHFVALYHHELKAKHFVASLRKTWEFLDKRELTLKKSNNQAHLLCEGLNITLSRLQQPDLIGGISFSQFIKDCPPRSEHYISQKPTLPEWNADKKKLTLLNKEDFPLFGGWLKVNLHRFSIQEIEQALKEANQLIKQATKENFSKQDLVQQLKLSNLVVHFYFQGEPLPLSVFQKETKENKTFKRCFNKWQKLKDEEEILQLEEKNWNKKFSLTELEEYISVLSSTHWMSISNYRIKKKLSRFTKLDLKEGKKALENLKELITIQQSIAKVKNQIRKLGIPAEWEVLNHIHYVIKKLNSVDKNDLHHLFELKEKERFYLYKNSQNWNKLHHILYHYFDIEEDQSIQNQLAEIQAEIPVLVQYYSVLNQLHFTTKKVLKQVDFIEEAEQLIYSSHWRDFQGNFPQLAIISEENIKQQVQRIIQLFDQESDELAVSICDTIQHRFEYYHTLLQTPAHKLSIENKQLKKRLRKGKSILVKAFSKKRVFPTVRELLESDAKHWIQLIHPVFLCSPYSVAKAIPMNYTFELGIFDEASQIPLRNVIGSVQRVRRAVISGDQQQMAPQFYFQQKKNQQTDVLSHAQYFLKNVLLTHHYRSKFPELIGYSNRYFYDNKLKTFPCPTSGNPIDLITVDGKFINRTNEEEATEVAELIKRKIDKQEFDFGLVAFSQSQLKAILDKLPPAYLNKLENKDTIFIQSLENVQGDQCNHLIISMGYGKNEKGDFHLRFGPLNQEQGHRRLNVLMSRAVSKITFVRSVSSNDFPFSENDGVELLRKLLVFLEQTTTQSTGFSSGKSVFTLHFSSSEYSHAQQIIDEFRILDERGWEVELKL